MTETQKQGLDQAIHDARNVLTRLVDLLATVDVEANGEPDVVMMAVCRAFGVSRGLMTSKRKYAGAVEARTALAYLLRQYCGLPDDRIAAVAGWKTSHMVGIAKKRAQRWMQADPWFRNRLRIACEHINSLVFEGRDENQLTFVDEKDKQTPSAAIG